MLLCFCLAFVGFVRLDAFGRRQAALFSGFHSADKWHGHGSSRGGGAFVFRNVAWRWEAVHGPAAGSGACVAV